MDTLTPDPDHLPGPVIAERRLSVRVSETEVEEVLIRMAAPERQDDDCYLCYWELIAPGYRRVRYAGGVDGFQAIQLATRMIGVTLWAVARENGIHFTWEGSDDVGFPDFHA